MLPFASRSLSRSDFYRIPHDRLYTDVFASWQDGGDGPTIGDPGDDASSDEGGGAGGGDTSGGRGVSFGVGALGEGAPLPLPPLIEARRQHYLQREKSFQIRVANRETAGERLSIG